MKIVKLLIIIPLVFLLSSCANISQELWIQPDFSSNLQVDIGISDRIIELTKTIEEAAKESEDVSDINSEIIPIGTKMKEIRDLVSKDSIVTNTYFSEFIESNIRHYQLNIDFNDIHNLPDLVGQYLFHYLLNLDEVEYSDLSEVLSITDQSHNTLMFREYIPANEPPQNLNNDKGIKPGQFMIKLLMKQSLKNNFVSLVIHAPYIKSTNGKLNHDRNTVSWKVPLTKLDEFGKFEAEIDLKGV